jgi:hypothetical protein
MEATMAHRHNRCAHCGSKFGLVMHERWGQKFCRKSCREQHIAKRQRDYSWMRKWLSCPVKA